MSRGDQSKGQDSKKLNPIQPKRDFKETQPDREIQNKKNISHLNPVTKQQIEALETRRRKLAMDKKLEMKGPMGQSVKANQERQLAKKIAEMRGKLNAKKMGKRFNRSR